MAEHYEMYFGCHKGHFFIPLYTDLDRISEDEQYETFLKSTYFSQINLELSKWESRRIFEKYFICLSYLRETKFQLSDEEDYQIKISMIN